MYLIEIVVSTLAIASGTPYGSLILLAVIPFSVVGLVVVTVFFMRRKQKRRMRDM